MTLYQTENGYQVRVLTHEQKGQVEKTIAEYRKLRGEENVDDDMRIQRVTTAYRSLPDDVRVPRFYQILGSGNEHVELMLPARWSNACSDSGVELRLPRRTL